MKIFTTDIHFANLYFIKNCSETSRVSGPGEKKTPKKPIIQFLVIGLQEQNLNMQTYRNWVINTNSLFKDLRIVFWPNYNSL